MSDEVGDSLLPMDVSSIPVEGKKASKHVTKHTKPEPPKKTLKKLQEEKENDAKAKKANKKKNTKKENRAKTKKIQDSKLKLKTKKAKTSKHKREKHQHHYKHEQKDKSKCAGQTLNRN